MNFRQFIDDVLKNVDKTGRSGVCVVSDADGSKFRLF